jgi:hypothetical protein
MAADAEVASAVGISTKGIVWLVNETAGYSGIGSSFI